MAKKSGKNQSESKKLIDEQFSTQKEHLPTWTFPFFQHQRLLKAVEWDRV